MYLRISLHFLSSIQIHLLDVRRIALSNHENGNGAKKLERLLVSKEDFIVSKEDFIVSKEDFIVLKLHPSIRFTFFSIELIL